MNMESADDFTLGAEVLLALNPKSGTPASKDRSIWYLPMTPVRDRRVSLFYSLDEHTVIFLAIQPFDD